MNTVARKSVAGSVEESFKAICPYTSALLEEVTLLAEKKRSSFW